MTQNIDTVAQSLRQAYLMRRNLYATMSGQDTAVNTLHPKWDGGRDSRGQNHKGVWTSLAAYAINNNLDVTEWVFALFSLAHTFAHIPWPSDLKSPTVLKHLRSSESRRKEECKQGLLSELLLLRRELFFRSNYSGLSRDKIVRALLVDPTVDISPIARFLLAVLENQLDIAEEFRNRASLQFQGCPEIYRELFPNEVKNL